MRNFAVISLFFVPTRGQIESVRKHHTTYNTRLHTPRTALCYSTCCGRFPYTAQWSIDLTAVRRERRYLQIACTHSIHKYIAYH